jgi:hypothetical protein
MYQQITLSKPNNVLEKHLINLFHSSGLPLHSNHTGYKDFSNYQRISLIVLFRRSKKSIRDFLKEFKESKWISWLHLKRIPSKSAFHNWLMMFGMNIIRKLIRKIANYKNLKITAIDGTGIQSNFQSRYYEKRRKDFNLKNKRPYHKLDVIVDTFGKKQILEYCFLLKNRSDSFVGKKLVKKKSIRRCKMLADKGYPDYAFADLAKANQNNFISPPKNYKGKCRHNNFKRNKKIANFKSNESVYRRRPIVECVFSSMKRVQDLKLRNRLSFMKKREMRWHVLYYNFRMNVKFETNKSEIMQTKVETFFILILIY